MANNRVYLSCETYEESVRQERFQPKRFELRNIKTLAELITQFHLSAQWKWQLIN
jgi:hypothetical protein